jgi:pyrimidine operon attenuation protein/uracil phosphoribosyltransferase
VVCSPIFDQFGYSIACRIANELTSLGIKSHWIDKIICTRESEGTKLARQLARVLDKSKDDVIEIDRELLRGAPLSASEFRQRWHDLHGEEFPDLTRLNMIAVDQAKHHFGTFAALKRICSMYESKVLAFAVFLDRLHQNLELDDYLGDSHSIALYRWPFPPHLGSECPCSVEWRG